MLRIDYDTNHQCKEQINKKCFSKYSKILDNATKNYFFIKAYKNVNDKVKQEQFINERLSNINNKHIVKYLGSHQQDDFFYLKFEYFKNGSLHEILDTNIRFLSLTNRLKMISQITFQIVKGLISIHKMGIIHMDLHLSNIIVSKNSKNKIFVKIADFNNSQLYDGTQIINLFGQNEAYCSGLLTFNYKKPSFTYDYLCLGIILYQLVFLKDQIYFSSLSHLKSKILEEINTHYMDSEFQIYKDFIHDLITIDESDKLNDNSILKHPFLTKRVRK